MTLDELQNKLLEYLNGAEKALVDLGPKAWEATIGLVYLNGFLTLVTGGVLIALALIVGVTAHSMANNLWRTHLNKIKNDKYYDDETAEGISSIVLRIMSVGVPTITGIAGMAHLFSKSAWIAIINPELGFLWEVYQKFLAS